MRQRNAYITNSTIIQELIVSYIIFLIKFILFPIENLWGTTHRI